MGVTSFPHNDIPKGPRPKQPMLPRDYDRYSEVNTGNIAYSTKLQVINFYFVEHCTEKKKKKKCHKLNILQYSLLS